MDGCRFRVHPRKNPVRVGHRGQVKNGIPEAEGVHVDQHRFSAADNDVFHVKVSMEKLSRIGNLQYGIPDLFRSICPDEIRHIADPFQMVRFHIGQIVGADIDGMDDLQQFCAHLDEPFKMIPAAVDVFLR